MDKEISITCMEFYMNELHKFSVTDTVTGQQELRRKTSLGMLFWKSPMQNLALSPLPPLCGISSGAQWSHSQLISKIQQSEGTWGLKIHRGLHLTCWESDLDNFFPQLPVNKPFLSTLKCLVLASVKTRLHGSGLCKPNYFSHSFKD